MVRDLRRACMFGALLVLSLEPKPASAQSPATPPTSAREHYDSGLNLVAKGDVDAAVKEFEEAYSISPNALVLYNLGQAYLELGNPVRAMEAFRGYLQGTPNLKPDRQREVNALIAQCMRRIGTIMIAVYPAQGEVFIDGRSEGKAPLPGPVMLSIGRHAVNVTAPGFAPVIHLVDIDTGVGSSLVIQLERAPDSASVIGDQIGQLSLSCAVPAVSVAIDGKLTSFADSDPVLLKVGKHVISWTRIGYQPSSLQVDIAAGRVTRAACDLQPLPQLSDLESGKLYLAIDPPGAAVQIDGRGSPSAARLPRGPHLVAVKRRGYFAWSQLVNVQGDRGNHVTVILEPTAEHAAQLARSATRKKWAYVIGGTGLAFLGGGAALYVDNGSRYQHWQNERDAFLRALDSDVGAANLYRQERDVRDGAVSIQRRDDLAIGVGLVGVGLVSYAVVSWLTAER